MKLWLMCIEGALSHHQDYCIVRMGKISYYGFQVLMIINSIANPRPLGHIAEIAIVVSAYLLYVILQ